MSKEVTMVRVTGVYNGPYVNLHSAEQCSLFPKGTKVMIVKKSVYESMSLPKRIRIFVDSDPNVAKRFECIHN